MNNFNFTSSIKEIQNRMVASSIKQTSNIELLRSEEAIKDLIKSYTDRFRVAEGMLTDAASYIAESKTIINVSNFNNLFESLFIDLSALYNELEIVDNVLTLNLSRNKNYFVVIKKRVKELWQRLRLARLNIYDLNPANESFFESFYSDINIDRSSNIVVDKKLGFIYLKPNYHKVNNKSFQIKSITSTVYPVENEENGVLITTSSFNDLSGNYSKDGTQDMLENGLWKEEVLCSEVPNMLININSTENFSGIYRNYKGVVAIVDIEYVYPVEINRLDIDIFGDKALDVDGVLYKTDSDGEWAFAQREVEDYQVSDSEELQYTTVRGRAFDVLSFLNIEPITAKVLRLIFNQKNFSYINTPDTTNVSLSNKLTTDLSERRYDLLKFNANLEEELTAPVNEENKSIYYKLITAVESTRNIQDILIKISDILIPPLKVSTLNFGKVAKYEVGTWSVEPKYEEYASLQGGFDTTPFSINDRHLIGATLTTKQKTPAASTINWYFGVEGKNIPVVENDSALRKESFNSLDLSSFTALSTWPGTFCLLDLPIDPLNVDRLSIYENGIETSRISSRVAFLNSRLLYFPDITNFSKNKLVVKYPVALYNCCNVYVLQPWSGKDVNKDLVFGLCSTRRETLEQFIRTTTMEVSGSNITLNEHYTITNALCTIEEAKVWFNTNYNKCIFIDNAFNGILDYSSSILSSLISVSSTKYSTTTLTDIEEYLNLSIFGPSDLRIISFYPNMVPLSNQRII